MVVAAARLMTPPERMIAPEEVPKVMFADATVPLTIRGPAPRGFEVRPKLRSSAVVVVTVPEGVAVKPVFAGAHPWVLLFVVGEAHVP